MLTNRRRFWKYGSNALVSSIFFLGILTIVVLIADRHPWRLDLTKSGAFTLSEQTRNVLNSIKEPIEIKAFYATAAPEEAEAKDLFETYQYYNKRISYQFIDPDRQPEKARQYDIRSYGTLVLEGYGKQHTILDATEESLTNGILKLTREQQKKIYFLIGHGEHSLEELDKEGYSTVKSALQKENYDVEELNLLQHERVPDDVSVLVIAGPRKPLFGQELTALRNYLDQGGKLMVFLDPTFDAGLKEFLRQYGIGISDDIVIDKLSKVFGGSYLLPVVTEYGLHKITENFNVATFYPEARSVRPAKDLPKGIEVEILASTSPNAWAETDFDLLQQGQASFDEKTDQAGPVPLMVLAAMNLTDIKANQPEAKSETSSSKEKKDIPKDQDSMQAESAYLLVAGDSDFINNTHFGLSGNGDFFLNIVNFLAEEENLITIEPRKGDGQPVMLTQSQAQMLLWTVLVFVPLTLLLIGVGVYRVRRSQR